MKHKIDTFNTYIHNTENEHENNLILNELLCNFEDTQKKMQTEKNISIREYLGASFIEKTKKIRKLLEEYFKGLEIENKNIYFRPTYIIKESKQAYAQLNRNSIEIPELSIDDKIIAEISYLMILAHEYYHCSGSLDFVAKRSKGGEINKVDLERSGAIIHSKKNIYESSAIEEGMAISFEKKAFTYIGNLYKEEDIKKYIEFQKKFYKAINKNKIENDNITHTNLIICSLDQKTKKINAHEGYNNAYILTNYLKEQIPDFIKKTEKLRVYGNYLPIARVIEQKYGKGMFKEIFLLPADEDKISKMLEKLNKISNENDK